MCTGVVFFVDLCSDPRVGIPETSERQVTLFVHVLQYCCGLEQEAPQTRGLLKINLHRGQSVARLIRPKNHCGEIREAAYRPRSRINWVGMEGDEPMIAFYSRSHRICGRTRLRSRGPSRVRHRAGRSTKERAKSKQCPADGSTGRRHPYPPCLRSSVVCST